MGNIYAIRLKKIVKSILPSSGVLWLRERQTSALAFIGYVNHYGAFHKKEEKNVITIVFLVTMPQLWNSLKTVYQAAEKNDNVKAWVVVVPNVTIQSDGSCLESYVFFKKECQHVVDARLQTGYFDIRKLRPDFIFRQSPYDDAYPKEYSYARLARYGKTCYVPYNYNFSPKKHLVIEYNEKAMRNLFVIFSESESNREYCLKEKERIRWYKDLHVFYLGFPRFDLYDRKWMEATTEIKKCEKNRYFTWIPRWATNSEENDGTGFFAYHEHLVSYFRKHRELKLKIRPHPLMFQNFIRVGKMTEKEVEEFRIKIAEETNIELDDNIDYLETFCQTDVLIADMSSINFEFFLTGKPIIYCGDTEEYNKETEDMMRYCYKINNWGNLETYLDMLAKGDDPDRIQRYDAAKKYFENVPQKIGEAIIDKCLEIL